MKVLLKLGYTTYLLPDDKGITTVMRALTRAVEVSDHRYNGEGLVVRDKKPVTVEISYVPPGDKVVWPKAAKEEAEPELLRLTRPKSIIIPAEEA